MGCNIEILIPKKQGSFLYFPFMSHITCVDLMMT